MAQTIAGQTTEQLAAQRMQAEQQAKAQQTQQANIQAQTYQSQQPQQTQTAPYITHAELKAAREQGASIQTGSPDQYGRATYAYVNGKLYNIALPEFAPVHAGTQARGVSTIEGIERPSTEAQARGLSDRPGEFEQRVVATGVSTVELKKAGYDVRELEQQQKISELKQAIYKGEPGIKVSGEIKRQVETAKGIERMLKSPTAEFSSQETAQRGFEKVLAWNPEFETMQVKAGLKQERQTPIEYQSKALDDFRKAAGLNYPSPFSPRQPSESQYYGLIQGMPLVKRQYDVSQYPTLKEYSILGFPIGRDIPVQAGKTYIRPSLFGKLQETDIQTRKVSEKDISTLNILGQGVALLSPVMPKVFAAARTGKSLKLFPEMPKGGFAKISGSIFGEYPKLTKRILIKEKTEPPIKKDILADIREQFSMKEKPSIEVRKVEEKGYTVIDKRKNKPSNLLEDINKQIKETNKQLEETGFTVSKRGKKIEMPVRPKEEGIIINKEIKTSTGQILIQKQILKPLETIKRKNIMGQTKQISFPEKLEKTILPLNIFKSKTIEKTKPSNILGNQIFSNLATKTGSEIKINNILGSQQFFNTATKTGESIKIKNLLGTSTIISTKTRESEKIIQNIPLKEQLKTPIKEIPITKPPIINLPKSKYDLLPSQRKSKKIKTRRKKITTPFSTIGDIFNLRGRK